MTQPAPVRLLSLDVLRGLTVAGMILVTDPGTYAARYAPLIHAEWTGGSLTDLIFPSFLFTTGVALTLSFGSRLERGASGAALLWHSLRRAVLLTVLGLFLNAFPTFDWHTVRIPGILQRIGLCYLASAVLYVAASAGRVRRSVAPMLSLALVSFALLAAYALVLRVVVTPGFPGQAFTEAGNLPGYLDRRIFGVRHLWPYGTARGFGVMFDPEGVLSTLGALATTLFGVVTGLWMRRYPRPGARILYLAAAAAAMIGAGFALSPAEPIIKKIWTPSFACVSGGAALLLFVALYWLIDQQRIRAWTPPALVFGTNAILAFAISTVITTLLGRVHVGALTVNAWGYQHLFLPWLSPINASLAWAVLVTLFNLLLLLPLNRRRVFLKI